MSSSIQDLSKKTSFEIFNQLPRVMIPSIGFYHLDSTSVGEKVNTLLPQKNGLRLLDLATGHSGSSDYALRYQSQHWFCYGYGSIR